jgi:hypothetical protein
MIEKTYRRAADPDLVAAIRAHKAALGAAGAAPGRRFTLTMAPRYPAPPEPPTPPTPEPAPTPPPTPTPTPDTDDNPSSMFGPEAVAKVYKAREEVLRRVGVVRVAALDAHTGAGIEVTSPVPTRSAPVGWPDPTEVYARRREDVRRAAQHRRRE